MEPEARVAARAPGWSSAISFRNSSAPASFAASEPGCAGIPSSQVRPTEAPREWRSARIRPDRNGWSGLSGGSGGFTGPPGEGIGESGMPAAGPGGAPGPPLPGAGAGAGAAAVPGASTFAGPGGFAGGPEGGVGRRNSIPVMASTHRARARRRRLSVLKVGPRAPAARGSSAVGWSQGPDAGGGSWEKRRIMAHPGMEPAGRTTVRGRYRPTMSRSAREFGRPGTA